MKGVQGRWLQSYTIVLLIPIMMMVPTYLQTRQVIEEEISRANSALLSQLQQEIDSYIDYTYRLAEIISINPKVASLIRSQQELGWAQRMEMVELLADFKSYNIARRNLDHFYIYFHDGDFVLADNSYYESDMYFDERLGSSGSAPDNWRNYLKQEHRGEFVSLREFGGGTMEGIMYAQSLSVQGGKYPATLVIELNQERLLASIRNIQSYNQGNVYILDERNQIMASSESRSAAGSSFAVLDGLGETGTATDHWDREKVVLSYTHSDLVNWKYVYALPASLYSQKAEYVRNTALLALAAAAIAGFLLAVLLARKNYHPLQRLIRNVAERSKQPPGSLAQINEYDYLEEAIDSALDRNTLMHRTIEKQSKTIRSHLLARILKGRIEQGFPLEEVLSQHGIVLHTQDLAVMLFYLEDYSGFFRQDEQDEEKNREFVQLIITNIVEELAGQEHQGWITEVDDMLACIINFRPHTAQDAAIETLRSLAEEAQRFIGNRFHILFTVSVSTLHRSAAELPAAYQEALEAMEYRLLLGVQTIIWYDRIKYQELSYGYPMEKEQQLINYVNAGDFPGAKQTLDDIIDSNLGQEHIPVEMIRCLMFDMCSTMMKAAMEANLGRSQLYEENLEAIRELMNGSTVSAMRERMTLFLRKVCGHAEERRKKNKFRLKESVQAYIAENYRDYNLSINIISRHFDVHPSYLSRYFKEQAGDNLTEYINRYRVEQAKILLQQEDILIKDISDMVGFYNISTFVRLFKKYEGVTPSVYRESAQ
jgi:YesN/AraC family two-component response regulator